VRRRSNALLRGALATAFAVCGIGDAAAQGTRSETTFAVAPYLWLPSISGTLKYGPPPGSAGGPSVEVGPDDYLAQLEFAFMIAGEMRKGRWSVFADFVYVNVSAEASQIRSLNFGGSNVTAGLNAGVETSLQGEVFTLAGGYRVFRYPSFTLDGLAGMRYFGLQTETDWRLTATVAGPGAGQAFPANGTVSKDADLFDGIVGMRGRFIQPNTPWSFPYHFDIGTGSSALTWQAMVGVSYAFKSLDVGLFYRHLSFDQSSDKFIQDFSFSGPALAAIFRF
jgi:hypothetical protein